MKHLVVGVDGRAPSEAALRWAVAAVGRRGAVHVVAALSPPPASFDVPHRLRSDPRAALGEELRRTWIAPFDGAVAQLTSAASTNTAPDALLRAAGRRDADAIVIGAHVSRGIPKTTGSTIRELLASLPCPLIVVPSTAAPPRTGHEPIIVGVGRSSATEAAIRWSAHEAEATGRPLGLVRATGDLPLFRIDGLLDVMALYLEPEKRAEWTREDLAEWSERAQELTDAQIEVSTAAVPGVPAVQLVEASETAELLVIGHPRDGVFGDHHIARPLRYALTHARCPVVVVPDD